MPPAKLFFQDDGPKEGPVVVLLHGFPLEHTMWDAQALHLLGKGFRVIRPDLRGHGLSPIVDEPATIERMVADIRVLCEQLKLTRFRLGGFSMGGYVALEFIRRHPERVESLLLVDTRAEPDSEAAKNGRRDLIAAIQTRGTGALLDAMLPKLLSEQTKKLNAKLVETVKGTILRTASQGAISALEGIMQRPDQRPTLGSIEVPTMVVVGAEDQITPLDAARVLQQGIRNAQLRIVTGAAHLVPMEQPEPLNHFLDHWVKGLTDMKHGWPAKEAL